MKMTEKEEAKIRSTYRKVFSTVEGKAVLTDLLRDLGYWRTDDNGGHVEDALRSFANRILFKLGSQRPDQELEVERRQVDAMVEHLCSISIKPEKPKED